MYDRSCGDRDTVSNGRWRGGRDEKNEDESERVIFVPLAESDWARESYSLVIRCELANSAV